jgi:hypothetical protein
MNAKAQGFSRESVQLGNKENPNCKGKQGTRQERKIRASASDWNKLGWTLDTFRVLSQTRKFEMFVPILSLFISAVC